MISVRSNIYRTRSYHEVYSSHPEVFAMIFQNETLFSFLVIVNDEMFKYDQG